MSGTLLLTFSKWQVAIAKPCSLCPLQARCPRDRSAFLGCECCLKGQNPEISVASERNGLFHAHIKSHMSWKAFLHLVALPYVPPSLQVFLCKTHEGWRRNTDLNSLAWNRHILHLDSQSSTKWSPDSNLNAKEAGKC